MKWPVSFWIVFAILVAMSCQRKSSQLNNNVSPEQPPELPRFMTSFTAKDTLAMTTDTLLYYQRSACFGFCPTFHYTVFQNGLIRYEGIQHTEPLGNRFGLVSESWWKEVQDRLKLCKFFDLEAVYPVEKHLYIPDLPNTIITVKEYNQRKQIIDNHHAPKELKEFEFFLEDHFKKVNFRDSWD